MSSWLGLPDEVLPWHTNSCAIDKQKNCNMKELRLQWDMQSRNDTVILELASLGPMHSLDFNMGVYSRERFVEGGLKIILAVGHIATKNLSTNTLPVWGYKQSSY